MAERNPKIKKAMAFTFCGAILALSLGGCGNKQTGSMGSAESPQAVNVKLSSDGYSTERLKTNYTTISSGYTAKEYLGGGVALYPGGSA